MAGHRRAHSGLASRWLIFICLALVSVTAAAQALHFHADQVSPTAKHCPICPVLHLVAPQAHSVNLDFSLQTTAFLAAGIESHSRPAAESFALFSRPPPLV